VSTALGVGALIYDPVRDRVGEVVEHQGVLILRLAGGGPTWEADFDRLRPADAKARLRVRVNELNARRL
jgi:molybdenum cofactor biosynthesis enzyme MoaA